MEDYDDFTALQVNGKAVTRDNVRDWLKNKKVSLWADWCVTHPDRLEAAVDWFMRELSSFSNDALQKA